MKAEDYCDFNMLSGVEADIKDQILMGIHPTRRTARIKYLSRVPCEILLVHSDPGCGKSEQVAAAIFLCVAQDLSVLLITSRHEAVNACLTKAETIVKTSGIECVIVHVFDAAEDKAVCKR